jgi:hypothetical protein
VKSKFFRILLFAAGMLVLGACQSMTQTGVNPVIEADLQSTTMIELKELDPETAEGDLHTHRLSITDSEVLDQFIGENRTFGRLRIGILPRHSIS